MNDKNIAIKISSLIKRFGDLVAVNDLSLDIYQGEVFGFLGPNGAGKTTTINMVAGLLSPTGGKVTILDNYTNKKTIKTHIGFCPQENVFWPKLTCYEQLIFVGNTYSLSGISLNKRAEELLEWLGLTNKRNVLASKLSGGMKRRLNICLALVHNPEILILDEPEAGLDPQSRILVRSFIKSLSKEKTIILTTHNMDEADRLSNRVAIIDHGNLLLLDSPENLKKTIGEGDLLEIDFETITKNKLDKVVTNLKMICNDVKVGERTVLIKSKNLIEMVSQITDMINQSGAQINKITLRENTLEDVFIHLTGRKLRQ